MKTRTLYLLSIVLLVQWGIVSFIGGASKDGIDNTYYFVSFVLFWIGLVITISTTFRLVATRKNKK